VSNHNNINGDQNQTSVTTHITKMPKHVTINNIKTYPEDHTQERSKRRCETRKKKVITSMTEEHRNHVQKKMMKQSLNDGGTQESRQTRQANQSLSLKNGGTQESRLRRKATMEKER
jgi:hypothetical protein